MAAIPTPENRLIARLPASDRAQLTAQLEPVSVSFKERLYEEDKKITHVYFVTSGMISLVTSLDDEDDIIETGTIGREGMVGLPAFLGVMRPEDRAFCQMAGSALRMDVHRFLSIVDRLDSLRVLLGRYAYALMMMTAQIAACNRAHTVETRMARWLLMTHDRVDSDEFLLTQEFLGQMLGVHRPAVSLAGVTLQRSGLIRYTRGKITIMDRKGLEAASCSCYERIRRDQERVIG